MKKKYYSIDKNQPKAWLYLLPALLIIVVFSIYPLLRSFVLSFEAGNLLHLHYVGLNNYRQVLQDPIFIRSMTNTLLFGLVVVPIALIISTVVAWIIYKKVKHKAWFETIFFMPYVTSTLAIGIVFRYFFNGQYGIINYILSAIGLPTFDWLDDISMNMPTLIIFGIWTGLAFNIIILLAGLRNIPKEHYKIAEMYGASEGQMFWKITFPQLIPTLTFLLTVNLINAFKIYTQVYALFGGKAGIANSATTAVFYIYQKFQIDGRPGLAMAATVILFVVIMLITIIQNKLMKKVGQL